MAAAIDASTSGEVTTAAVYVFDTVSSARPPGSDFALSATNTNINSPNLDPQKAHTLELGTKWDVLAKRLALTAADPVTGEVAQFGKTRVHGIALSAIGQLTPAWQLIAGLANTRAKVVEGTRNGTATTGTAVRYSPKLTATLWSTYRLPYGLTVGGGARYVDTQARSTNAAAVAFFPEIPSYTVLDAMLGYEVNRNFSLRLNVFNLRDKFYLARVDNAGNRATVGTPRSAPGRLGTWPRARPPGAGRAGALAAEFHAAALPLRFVPPLFNRYAGAGHLRHAWGQAAGRRPGAVSGHRPAPRGTGHTWRPCQRILLGPEHGARRPPPQHAVRAGPGHPALARAARRRRGPPGPDRPLPQPVAAVGRDMTPPATWRAANDRLSGRIFFTNARNSYL